MLETISEMASNPQLAAQLREDWIYPVLLFIYIFSLYQSLSILQVSEYSALKENCLSVTYLMTPFVFFLLCRSADIMGAECLLYCLQKSEGKHLEHISFSRAMGAGVMMFWFVFIRLHRNLALKMNELKNKSE
jgi:hypothetical protein